MNGMLRKQAKGHETRAIIGVAAEKVKDQDSSLYFVTSDAYTAFSSVEVWEKRHLVLFHFLLRFQCGNIFPLA